MLVFLLSIIGAFSSIFFVNQLRSQKMSSSEPTKIWKEKYCGHEFSKTDMDDPSKFNIEEIKNYMDQCMYAYTYKGIQLVQLGRKIVTENNEFIMELPIHFEPRNHVIRLKNTKRIYTIDWVKQHIEDLICLSFDHKKYCFNDLSQIELYFDYLTGTPPL